LKDKNKRRRRKLIELLDGEIEKNIYLIKNGQKNIIDYI
jgi:hypothetical protein